MNIKNPEKKYRPIPFWSWNEKLNTAETKEQIKMMDKAGIGGYFMHARGGLQTEYMSDDWFSNIGAGIDEGNVRDMGAWAYDENGWPSGFGNGIVNGRGTIFQQKYLRIEQGEKHTDTTIVNTNGYHLYYEINPFYIDTLDEEAVKVFIDEIYQPYYDKFSDKMPGFFTDEPQISRNGIPWSLKLPQAYQSAYKEDIIPLLPQLFYATGNYKQTRFRFWKLVTNMFTQSFAKQIYDWCENHNMMLTGHMVLEEDLLSQLTSNGAVMPNYEYFHIPGMDWLGRNINPPTTPLQVSSVAHQLGKKQILSETFALTGWGVNFEELKWMFEWQMVRGITLLCPHLEGYSLRGIRKRDYPPSFFYQQPWWNEYKTFVDAVSRIGMLLTEGEVNYDTLIIHPQSTAWICYDDDKNQNINYYNKEFINAINILEQKHILFHIGDETIMERHAKVVGDTLIIGTQKYKTIVLPPHLILFESTNRLLDEFKNNGGIITVANEVCQNDIIDNPNITYTKRSFREFDMYYFVNSTMETQVANIKNGSEVLDVLTGDTSPFENCVTFNPMGSIVIFDKKQPAKPITVDVKPKNTLAIDAVWDVKNITENALTLDYCDYSFDGELIERHGHISSIQTKACDLGRAVKINMKFNFDVKDIPEKVYLVCETPEIFSITVNGTLFNKKEHGYYFDHSFKKMDLSGYLIEGNNEIIFDCDFEQSENTYENLKKSEIFESEKNKLTYDMEIENIYIVGDFSINTDGSFENLGRDAVRYSGNFSIANSKTKLSLSNIEQQGYPFFAGTLTLEKTFNLDTADCILRFDKRFANVVSVRVNGKEAGKILWNPNEVDLSKYLIEGENKVEITLINSLRNLLGPHHLSEGESHSVSPASFFKEKSIWSGWGDANWNDNYCFLEFGLKL